MSLVRGLDEDAMDERAIEKDVKLEYVAVQAVRDNEVLDEQWDIQL